VPWRGRDLAAVAGMGVLGLVATILVGVLIGWDVGDFTSPRAAVMLLLNGTVPAVLAYGYLRLRFGHEHRLLWRPRGERGMRQTRAVALGLGVGLAWWLVVDVLGLMLFVETVGYEPPPVQQELLEALSSPGLTQVAAWLAIVVIAPVGEEIVFRGIVFLGLTRWLGAVPAAFVSSVVFGLIHVQGDVAATAFLAGYAVPFGLFACWLLHRFGSLWLPITVHAASNLASVAVATAAGQV
jgi:membrane protease YdiL (CAAX protease family)